MYGRYHYRKKTDFMSYELIQSQGTDVLPSHSILNSFWELTGFSRQKYRCGGKNTSWNGRVSRGTHTQNTIGSSRGRHHNLFKMWHSLYELSCAYSNTTL